MANQTNGNQFRDEEIIVLSDKREGKVIKSIHAKIGGRWKPSLSGQRENLAETSL
jgi:hypothetical protein